MNNQRRKADAASAAMPKNDVENLVHGKRVLLAGASGTIGTAVAIELKKRGYWVRGLTRLASGVKADVDEIFVGDLLEARTLESAVKGIDLVVSAAGAPPGFVGAREEGIHSRLLMTTGTGLC
jgi:nucleoside-diphosphate-sugar epimerase